MNCLSCIPFQVKNFPHSDNDLRHKRPPPTISEYLFIHNFADVFVSRELCDVNKSGETRRLLSKIVCVYGPVLPVCTDDML